MTDRTYYTLLLLAILIVYLMVGCVSVPKQPCDGTFIAGDRRWACTITSVESVSWYPRGVGQAVCYEVQP